MKQLLNDSAFKNCDGQVDSVLPKPSVCVQTQRHMQMYKDVYTCTGVSVL